MQRQLIGLLMQLVASLFTMEEEVLASLPILVQLISLSFFEAPARTRMLSITVDIAEGAGASPLSDGTASVARGIMLRHDLSRVHRNQFTGVR